MQTATITTVVTESKAADNGATESTMCLIKTEGQTSRGKNIVAMAFS